TRVHFDFGPTADYLSSTTPETLAVGVVPTRFDGVASGLASGSTIHYRAVAASDFVSITGRDETVTIINEPPVVWIGDVGTVRLRDLGRAPGLSVTLGVNEPAMVTIQLFRKHKRVRQVPVTRASSGRLATTLALQRARPGNFPPRALAIDSDGAASAPKDLPLRIRR